MNSRFIMPRFAYDIYFYVKIGAILVGFAGHVSLICMTRQSRFKNASFWCITTISYATLLFYAFDFARIALRNIQFSLRFRIYAENSSVYALSKSYWRYYFIFEFLAPYYILLFIESVELTYLFVRIIALTKKFTLFNRIHTVKFCVFSSFLIWTISSAVFVALFLTLIGTFLENYNHSNAADFLGFWKFLRFFRGMVGIVFFLTFSSMISTLCRLMYEADMLSKRLLTNVAYRKNEKRDIAFLALSIALPRFLARFFDFLAVPMLLFRRYDNVNNLYLINESIRPIFMLVVSYCFVLSRCVTDGFLLFANMSNFYLYLLFHRKIRQTFFQSKIFRFVRNFRRKN